MFGKNFPVFFGALIAYVLLLLYAGTVAAMTYSAIDHGRKPSPIGADGKPVAKEPPKPFDKGVVNIVTLIGGLVSALVISSLTIAAPGDSPATTLMVQSSSNFEKQILNWMVIAYLFVWLGTGLMALVVGVMLYPNSSSTLGEIGATWLGLAVASAYAYFGLKPPAPVRLANPKPPQGAGAGGAAACAT
jgi:hypothetical protein